jgi:hypothetical protein
MSGKRVPATGLVEQLGITVNLQDGLATAGILIVRTIYPTNETGLIIGTSQTQSWVDNIGLVKAAETVIANDMLIHTIRSLND